MKKMYVFKVILVALILVTIGCKKAEEKVSTEIKPSFDLAEAKTAIETAGKTFVMAMNKVDSITLANCYTTDAKRISIIAQSAYRLSSDIQKAIATGCNDHISKPIDKHEFLILL